MPEIPSLSLKPSVSESASAPASERKTSSDASSEPDPEGFFALFSVLYPGVDGVQELPETVPALAAFAGTGAVVPAEEISLPEDVAAEELFLPLNPVAVVDEPLLAPSRSPLVLAVKNLLKPLSSAAPASHHLVLAQAGDTGSTSAAVLSMTLGKDSGLTTDAAFPLSLPLDPTAGSRPVTMTAELAMTPLPALGQAVPLSISSRAGSIVLPPFDVPLGHPEWDHKLGERILWMVGKGVQQAEVRLSPPHLGSIDIRVSVHNDQTNVSFAAQHTLTREAIEAALPRLREMMQEARLDLINVDVGERAPGRQAAADYSGSGGGPASHGEASIAGDDLTTGVHSEIRTSRTGLVDDYA